MNLQALIQERADLVAAGKKFFDALGDTTVLTPEQAKEDDERTARLTALDDLIARARAQREREKNLEVARDPNEDPAPEEVAGRITSDAPKWKHFGEFLTAVRRAGDPEDRFIDPRLERGMLAAASGASESVPSEGGFLVGTQESTGLLDRAYNTGEILQRVNRIPIGAGANGLKINAVDESSRVDGSRWGGIRGYWTNEAALLTGSKPKFRQIDIDLEKLTGLCYATDELLADTTALAGIINAKFPEELRFKVEDGIINGTGAGQPLGIMNSAARVTVAKEAAQAAATIVVGNIVKMWARMWARSMGNAVWFINQDTIPQIFQIAAADSSPVFLNNGAIQNAPIMTIFGRPVIPVEYCATLGTEGDIILADMSEYLVIDKNSVESASSIHVRFIYEETTFRFTYRVNGQPAWDKPLTPKNGSNTLSPFITLAVRA